MIVNAISKESIRFNKNNTTKSSNRTTECNNSTVIVSTKEMNGTYVRIRTTESKSKTENDKLLYLKQEKSFTFRATLTFSFGLKTNETK